MEESDNVENINPTLGFNFPTETIMKIVRLIHFCLQENSYSQLAMSYVIDEINGALQVEEGLKAEQSEVDFSSNIGGHLISSKVSIETHETLKGKANNHLKQSSHKVMVQGQYSKLYSSLIQCKK